MSRLVRSQGRRVSRHVGSQGSGRSRLVRSQGSEASRHVRSQGCDKGGAVFKTIPKKLQLELKVVTGHGSAVPPTRPIGSQPDYNYLFM